MGPYRALALVLALSSILVFFATRPLYAARAHLSQESGGPGYLLHAHAHNDYMFNRPLVDSLNHRFYSVEADIGLHKGKLEVSHNGNRRAGYLEELYLKPLQKRVDRLGSVYGDREVFYLWLDIKDPNPKLVKVLHRLLSSYSMFTVFTDKTVIGGPVTVILTGHPVSKKRYVDTFARRWAVMDSNEFSLDDPPANNRWQFYAIDWIRHFRWAGKNRLPAGEQEAMNQMVEHMHLKGYRVRFFNTPDDPSFWEKALKAKVDFINTNRIKDLKKVLSRSLR